MPLLRTLLVVAIAGASLATPVFAAPSFTGPTHFATGPSPAAVIWADVTGQGRLDLVTANSGSATGAGGLTVLPNTTTNTAGPVTFGTAATFGTGPAPAAVVLGDLNGDLRPDLALANSGSASGANGVSVLLNTGGFGQVAPSFSGPTGFAAGANPASIAVLDVNRDGRADLVTANKGSANGSNGVSVLMNRTEAGATVPAFAAPVHFNAGKNPAGIATGEINRDFDGQGYSRRDIAVANSGSNDGTAGVSVLLNSTPVGAATPSFAGPTNFNAGKNPAAVVLNDLNNDTPFKTDIATANSGSNDGTDGVSVLLNTNTADGATTPSFGSPAGFDTGANPAAIDLDVSADFKGQLTDIVTANKGSAGGTDGISILSNETPGAGNPVQLTGPVNLDAGAAPAGIASADLTGDAPIEIVTANSGSTTGANGLSVQLYAMPADGQTSPCSGSPNQSTTWSSSTGDVYLPTVWHPQAYSTRVVARGPAGETVFDQVTSSRPGSQAANALIASARTALRGRYGDGATLAGPALESSSVATGPQSPAGGTFRHSFQGSVSTDLAIGPGTILVGENQSQTHFIPAGCSNLNTHLYLQYFGENIFKATQTNNATYGLSATLPASPPPAGLIVAGCLNADATQRGKALGPAQLGRKQAAQRGVFKGARLTSRRGLDHYCATGGGNFRIGYPTKRLRKGLKRSLVKKTAGRVVLILTSSRRFTVAGAKVGQKVRVRGFRKIKVGKNDWHVRAKGATVLLVKARRGKVLEVGIADSRLGRGKSGLKRLVRGWQIN